MNNCQITFVAGDFDIVAESFATEVRSGESITGVAVDAGVAIDVEECVKRSLITGSEEVVSL